MLRSPLVRAAQLVVPVLTGLLPSMLVGQTAAPAANPVQLPAYTVEALLVANQEPAGVMNMPVSALRYEPRVDLQTRNFAEAQADIAIRGGIFESSGFSVGALTLYDPQTGHYFAEVPVAPAMLNSPTIRTGAANALRGFNATVGTVGYGWRPIENHGQITVGAGESGYNGQSFYEGRVYGKEIFGGQFAADVEWARSTSDGSIQYGDHDFQRVSGRIQHRTGQHQTDIFAGYQAKFFGWPNMYTPFGVNETESLQTILFALNHHWTGDAGNEVEFGAYYRRNRDDYEYSRQVPGQFNPYQHTTIVRGAALHGRRQFDTFAVNYSAQMMSDDLQSTSLTAGPSAGRYFLKLAAVPEKTFSVDSGTATVRAGVTYDESNRGKHALSPIARLQLDRSSETQFYAEYSEATQLPTYTATKSSPSSGLFRGNPALGRETSRNLEIGAAWKAAGWKVEAAVFHRWDDDLADWTYTQPPANSTANPARSANAVDIRTTGVEVVAVKRTTRYDLVLGYTWLHKDSDYRVANIDASFYALNFPLHRLTAALTVRLGQGWEIRSDNEFRVQEKNIIRRIGGDQAVISTLGLHYLPPRVRGLELSLVVDNLWDSDFQELPAVPAGPRQWSGSISYRW